MAKVRVGGWVGVCVGGGGAFEDLRVALVCVWGGGIQGPHPRKVKAQGQSQ